MNITTQVISHNPKALLGNFISCCCLIHISIGQLTLFSSLIDFTVLTTTNILSCASAPSHHTNNLTPLNQFIQDTYTSKKVPVAVQLFTLFYLLRLKSKLPDNARGAHDTPYRLFLAALLTASKYLSETGTGLTSMHLTSRCYSPKEINRMERSFLGLLRYDLWVSADDLQQFVIVYGDLIQIDIHQVSLNDSLLLGGSLKRCSAIIDTTTIIEATVAAIAAAAAANNTNNDTTAVVAISHAA
jgi:hypothetical protein